jgi:hypothetical protein
MPILRMFGRVSLEQHDIARILQLMRAKSRYE